MKNEIDNWLSPEVYKAQIKQLKQKIKELEKEIENQEASLGSAIDSYAELCTKKDKEINQLKNQLKTLNKINEGLNKDIELWEIENQKLKNQLKDSYADGQNNMFSVMQPKIDNLEKDKEELVDMAAWDEGLIEKLKTQLKESDKQVKHNARELLRVISDNQNIAKRIFDDIDSSGITDCCCKDCVKYYKNEIKKKWLK